MPERLSPDELASLRSAVVWDIRPLEERLGPLGWIPGSLSLPAGLAPTGAPAVLACQSGRRSWELAQALAERGVEVFDLQGGLLAWSAAYPTTSPPSPAPGGDELTLGEFRRLIRSCFVVEAVEAGVYEGVAAADPLQAVADLFDPLEGAAPPRLWERIDELAHLAWRLGHRLDAIAANSAEFYALAQRVR